MRKRKKLQFEFFNDIDDIGNIFYSEQQQHDDTTDADENRITGKQSFLTDQSSSDSSDSGNDDHESEDEIDDHVDRISTISDATDDGNECENIFKHHDIVSAMYTSASLVMKVTAIAIFFNLPNMAVNAILALLRYLKHDVPKDARTIKKTPRNGPTSNDFEHIGLQNQLKKKLLMENLIGVKNNEILIDINIDGIPLFKSSNINSWPILIRICNIADKRPFPVSILAEIANLLA